MIIKEHYAQLVGISCGALLDVECLILITKVIRVKFKLIFQLSNLFPDSDRFIWRRAQSCLKFSGNFVIGEVEDCPEKDMIELAAYTYDNGTVPFHQENAGILLKIFETKVKVETWYIFKLIISPFNTVFQLFDDSHQLLESKMIAHRECGSSFYIGALQSLYFG